jgi:hypothetical protein
VKSSILAFMKWVESTDVAVLESQSAFGFAALDMFHIGSISVVFGMIAVLDLRLMGIAFKDLSVTELSRQVLPWTWAAFVIAAITGVLMFTGQASRYSVNFAFLAKLIVMAIAGVNVLVFHFLVYPGVADWDSGRALPLAARLAGTISLACWIAVTFYGRFTAYYMF